MGGSSILQSVLLLSSMIFVSRVQAGYNVFNVHQYGAVADRKIDNSKAFVDAWNQACQSRGRNVVYVPNGVYFIRGADFQGPCKGQIIFELDGVLQAAGDQQSTFNVDHWISFQYIDNLVVHGGGTFDGQGSYAWPHNDCNRNPRCSRFPASLRFTSVTNAKINHLKVIDGKNFHIILFKCYNIVMKKMKIMAPGDSPNTDGIHIGSSENIQIFDSVIAVGDDCVSLGPGSKSINITNIVCGPGHGISIGSLGKYPGEEAVEGLTIRNSSFSGTQNGVRIKTWSPSTPCLVSDILFQHLYMNNVANPIVIDQTYCPLGNCPRESYSSVQIQDVKFIDIWGSSSTEVAVNLECSKIRPCNRIMLKDINLVYKGPGKSKAYSLCSHVQGDAYDTQIPPSCLRYAGLRYQNNRAGKE